MKKGTMVNFELIIFLFIIWRKSSAFGLHTSVETVEQENLEIPVWKQRRVGAKQLKSEDLQREHRSCRKGLEMLALLLAFPVVFQGWFGLEKWVREMRQGWVLRLPFNRQWWVEEFWAATMDLNGRFFGGICLTVFFSEDWGGHWIGWREQRLGLYVLVLAPFGSFLKCLPSK